MMGEKFDIVRFAGKFSCRCIFSTLSIAINLQFFINSLNSLDCSVFSLLMIIFLSSSVFLFILPMFLSFT